MQIFCTLFDSHYFSRGLTMYNSLKKNTADFRLYIVCFDDYTYNGLLQLNFPEIIPISLNQFEDIELLEAKKGRTKAEYCWTSTSSVILYVLNTFNEPECTYLDADLYFFSDPGVLLDEAKNHSVMITEHRFSAPYKHYVFFGIYNVQFMYFKNDVNGRKVLDWWRSRCLEWCYDRSEDGKFGDQKYLDQWNSLFEGIHVMHNTGGGVAPWNVQSFTYEQNQNVLFQCNKQTKEHNKVIFYHFHKFKLYKEGFGLAHTYDLSKDIADFIYTPYYQALLSTIGQISKVFPDFASKGFNSYNEGRLYLNYLLNKKNFTGDCLITENKENIHVKQCAAKPVNLLKNIFIRSFIGRIINKVRFFILYH
ncbi:MAG: hypothetical protein A2015_11145 [Spirochaetes bacterium GWF1_31_7]|nr:MAG: hypothetical protein A2Y30_02380 [Spirochaetes bacterium GWE1_32_154]OHD46379.1 MAG: hypothetical protein A2Y29_04240 [Spirochaetes bacterium GWE2_31_10]OHD47756.1 MAG: hypothetical protein A2015_11145 [Spirochaetes bacterium GWF1_31_7]HBD95607.1 glycosyl transferase [Spirochaetia bacterium]HBI37480.1 glycosyl transferase [Spirochaetia bacterium]